MLIVKQILLLSTIENAFKLALLNWMSLDKY